MRKVKFLLAFIAIGIMFSACEFSPEEIQPVGKAILENYPGTDDGPDYPDDPPTPPE
ncbi:MAG: hypothetical protein O7F74_02265 [Bacteroidetes bacterium]|nr:hypothetical protein [Bacteroidota bacterium]